MTDQNDAQQVMSNFTKENSTCQNDAWQSLVTICLHSPAIDMQIILQTYGWTMLK